ncbi:cytochrome P450 2C29-like [Bufo gargarizans]|uniref:cytochrome P450 2C29-like n=1 Tax=Bufo gargarizans TaxID=30331 RepID=UPI001CF1B25E|nr:cytochrome P450 2C29-like [Bufo gargarizans]
MALSIILAVLFILLIAHIIYQSWSQQNKYKSLPPGPTPIPVVGTPQYLRLRDAIANYSMLSKQYGRIFTIWKLSEPVIVLCGYEMLKAGLMDYPEEVCERPFLPVFEVATKGYAINGVRWRPLRRFALLTLRNLGMGKRAVEVKMLAECKRLVKAMAETAGKPFNASMYLASNVINIMATILFRSRFDYLDERLPELIVTMARHINGVTSPLSTLCNFVPALLYIPQIRHKVIKDSQYVQEFVAECIKPNIETFSMSVPPRDFIDHFMVKIKEVEHEKDTAFCDTSLLMVTVALLAGGTETTSTSLKFALVLLANYPEIQAKAQQEVDEYAKNSRQLEIEDRPHLPYTNAVLHECQRILDVAPTALFHTNVEEIKIKDYTIPKGSTLIPFLTSVLRDPTQWETPEEFNPGHFLTEDGQFRPRPAFLPFSAGKRGCPGQWLARMQLFIVFAAMVQNFTFKMPPGEPRRDWKYLNQRKYYYMREAEICAEYRHACN